MYALGVDLGTTFTAAATAKGDRVEIFQLGDRAATIPSVVVLRADGQLLTGEAADRRAFTDPTRTAREFKRRLGDPTPIILGGTPYGAEALMAELLRAVVARVVEQMGSEPDAIALAYPASYGPYKLELLRQAVRQADLGDVELITEPEAAALHYARQERLLSGQVVAVYDFGGGTFDATILRKTDTGFELLGRPEGMERLGGIDFDEAIFAHVSSSIGNAVRSLDPNDPRAVAAVARLREECRRAKEALSGDTDTTIPVFLPDLQTDVRLTRPEFEAMIRPRITETIAALRRTTRSAGLEFSDIDRVLLVGGTSRIPLIAEMVQEATGRPVALDAHPKHTIAMGAAFSALAALPAAGQPTLEPPPTALAAGPLGAAAGPLAVLAAGDGGDARGPGTVAAGADVPPHRPTPQVAGRGGSRDRWRRWLVIAAPAVVALVVAGAGVAALSGAFAGTPDADSSPLAAADESEDESTPTAAPSRSSTPRPTPTAAPTPTPTPTPAPNTAQITGISLAGGLYSVDFATFGYVATVPGQHVHFFFDTVPPEQAGVPGSGPWFLYGGSSPFTGYGVADRPPGATAMCILTANPDHSVIPDTGNCATLP